MLVSPRLIYLSQATEDSAILHFELRHEHHLDSSYSVRFSAQSGIRMHMGPGLFLHLSRCICPFTSLFFRLCTSLKPALGVILTQIKPSISYTCRNLSEIIVRSQWVGHRMFEVCEMLLVLVRIS